MAETKITSSHTIPDPIELAKEAWLIFKKRFWTIAGIGVLNVVAIFVLFIVAAIIGVVAFFLLGAKVSPVIIGVGTLLFLIVGIAAMLSSVWASGAYIVALADWEKKTTLKETIQKARPFILPLLLTSLLSAFIGFGSIFVFIIPAIVFGVWFTFWQYVVVLDGKRGLAALHQSREYLRGRFWGTWWRLFAIHLPEIVLGLVLSMLFKGDSKSGMTGLFQILTVIAIPFYMAYTYSLFSHLQKTSKEIPATVPGKSKALYLLVPIIGYIILVVSAAFVLPVAFTALQSMAQKFSGITEPGRTEDNVKPSTALISGIIGYNIIYQTYPKDLETLVEKQILPSVPTEPSTGKPYRYEMTKDGKDFKLCTPASVKPEKCVTSSSPHFDL